MQFEKPKILYAIALILLMGASSAFVLVPAASAHTPPWNIPTQAFLNIAPNPVGVNQQCQVTFWINVVPPTASTAYGDRWANYTVKITTPAGVTTTYGPFISSDVGANDFTFTPTAVGNYSVQFFFPGETLPGANPPPTGYSTLTAASIGDYYEASTSPVVTLTAQQSPVLPYPEQPLPINTYWQYPVNAMNPNWEPVIGDWLLSAYDGLGNRENPFTTAPMTAHIDWTFAIAPGGVVGSPTQATNPDWNYYTGLAYETKFSSPIIMEGNLIFNLPLSDDVGGAGIATVANGLTNPGSISINLRSGAVNWRSKYPVSYGQELDYYSPNQYGILPYIWTTSTLAADYFGVTSSSTPISSSSSMIALDPWTGMPLFMIANVTGGTNTFGPSGEIFSYVFSPTHGWLAFWNSTQDIMHYMQSINVWEWRPTTNPPGETVPVLAWSYGVMWNNTAETNYLNQYNASLALYKVPDDPTSADTVVATTGSISTPQNWEWEVGYNAMTGAQEWAVNRTTPIGATTWALMGPASNTVYTEFHEYGEVWLGFSMQTGQQLWTAAPYTAPFGMYSWQASIADGMLLGLDFGGYVHAYNLTTGATIWTFYAGNSGTSTAYGSWPLNNPPPTTADGEVFVVTGHAYNPPLFPGAQIFAINETTGQLVWSELGFYTYDPVEVADGVLVCYNCYDGQVYCYGQARSATTVSATPGIGDTMTIQGTVTDQSPGQSCLGIPVAGTPAVSDASMRQWEAYIYMQQPEPMNATGVPVTLTYTDPNHNTYTLATVTSDITGHYSYQFTPTIAGKYTITATFAGTQSYYASSAETAITYAPAPVVATASPTPTPTSVANLYFVPAIAGLFVLIIVVAIVLALLMLRKRP